jgi:hypothetical protein
MARPAAPLKKKYGLLTPTSERRVDGQRMVKCTCACGRVREVYHPHLNSGRVTSCGSVTCRPRKVTKQPAPVAAYHPRMPTGFTVARLRRFWKDAQLHPVARLSAKFKLPLSSTYMLLDRIRRFGDVEKFIAATGEEE